MDEEKELLINAINNTTWAEDVYPGIKEKLLRIVLECNIDSDSSLKEE